jgi:hypothetical protein
MNTAPVSADDNIEGRLRTMRILWIAMLLSIGVYYVFTLFVGRPEDAKPDDKLFLMLLGLGSLTTLVSFPFKHRLLNRAVEQQQPQVVQPAYVMAWALTEAAALLGLFDFFVTGDRYYYVLFIIAACGQLLHFPRREHVIDAAFKRTL